MNFHKAFHEKSDKLFQDDILLKCGGVPVQRCKLDKTRKGHEFAITYHVYANKKHIPVCP